MRKRGCLISARSRPDRRRMAGHHLVQRRCRQSKWPNPIASSAALNAAKPTHPIAAACGPAARQTRTREGK